MSNDEPTRGEEFTDPTAPPADPTPVDPPSADSMPSQPQVTEQIPVPETAVLPTIPPPPSAADSAAPVPPPSAPYGAAPVPPPPPAPAAPNPYATPSAPAGSAQPGTPYAAQPPAAENPYARPTTPPAPPAYGEQPYQQPTYGQMPGGTGPVYGGPAGPAYGAPGGPVYGTPTKTNTSAIVLVILSAIGTLSCCITQVPALIFAIIALSKQNTEPEASRRMTRFGWIAFAVGIVVALLVGIALAASDFFASTSGGYNY